MAIDHFLKLDFDFLSNEMTNIGITLHADADTDMGKDMDMNINIT